MRLKTISESIDIVNWSSDNINDDYDPWVAADQADQIAHESGIRISSDKDLTIVAIDNGNVIGAIWSSLTSDGNILVYDFDVAVAKSYRGTAAIGIKLIEAALAEFNELKRDHQVMIRVWAINPRLVGILERRFGFEIESQYRDGSAHMVLY